MQAQELLERRKSYIEKKMKSIDEEVEKMNGYFTQLRFLEVGAFSGVFPVVQNKE